MDFGIEGKTALLMSSTRGLGFGCAAALVAEGVRVVINGRNMERGMDAISRLGGKAHFVQAVLLEPNGMLLALVLHHLHVIGTLLHLALDHFLQVITTVLQMITQ